MQVINLKNQSHQPKHASHPPKKGKPLAQKSASQCRKKRHPSKRPPKRCKLLIKNFPLSKYNILLYLHINSMRIIKILFYLFHSLITIQLQIIL